MSDIYPFQHTAQRQIERLEGAKLKLRAQDLLRTMQVYDDVINSLPPDQRVTVSNAICVRWNELHGQERENV